MSDRNYPLPKPDDDPRFTMGLVLEIREVLVQHGYPEATGPDCVDLQQALFRFLYQNEEPASQRYVAGHGVTRALLRADDTQGMGEAERAAIDRLSAGTAELVDLRRLAPLAELAGLPWDELFPELAQ